MKIRFTVVSAVFALASSVYGQQPSAPAPAQTTRPMSPAAAPDAAPPVVSPAQSAAQSPAQSQTPSDAKPTAGTQTPSQSASPAGATPANVDNSSYVIGSEDSLQITVWREPTLSGTFPVRPDGMISMVLLQDVPASGKTPLQLTADITERLRKFFQDPPSVTVQVMAVNSQRIYLIGEVGHVGPVALSAGMTPLQAIATAGGLSNFANSKHIYILRGTGAAQQKIPFNYKQALKGDNHQQIVLRPGDTIVVP